MGKNERGGEEKRKRDNFVYAITPNNLNELCYISNLGLIFNLRPQYCWCGKMKEFNNAWSDLRIYRGSVGHQINGFIVDKGFIW